jgi:hypothetical protein
VLQPIVDAPTTEYDIQKHAHFRKVLLIRRLLGFTGKRTASDCVWHAKLLADRRD